MMLSVDDEYDRAAQRAPFSNGFEGESWMSHWCEQCSRDADDECPLVTVAFLGRVPRQWTLLTPNSLTHRYACREFKPREEPTR